MTAHYKREERLKKELMELWAVYSEPYRTIPKVYQALVEKKKSLKISFRRGERLNKADASSYPDVPFLKVEDEDAALKMLDTLHVLEMSELISEIQGLKTNYAYITYKNLIPQLKYQIKMHGRPRSVYGMDPDRMVKGYAAKKSPKYSTRE